MDLIKKMKRDFVAGSSYTQVAEKYGYSVGNLRKIGAREHWTDLRNAALAKKERIFDEQLVESVALRGKEIDEKVFEGAMELMNAYLASLKAAQEEGGVLPPSMLKDYGTALKSIQSVVQRPTELDLKEQKARIKKIEREAADDQVNEVEIRITGMEDAWAE